MAVIAVLVYHLDAPWLPGGFLGVSIFFTLSGYLITTLLLSEGAATGSIALGAFWARRARRLLPAALGAIVVAVAAAATVADAAPVRSLPGDVAASLGYAANWRFVATHTAYGAAYEAPSLLQHFWSLAIEEQFYLAYPLLVVVLRTPRRLQVALVAGVVASMAAGVVLHDPLDPARTYFGTDTRAAELLVGGILATVLRPDAVRAASRWVTAAGAVAGGTTIALLATANPDDAWLHRGGFAVVAVLSATLVRAALAVGPVSAALAMRPLTMAGTISYGLYVYHWPLFQAITEERTGLRGAALVTARVLPTLALAIASYRWLEHPVRRGRTHLSGQRLAAVGVGAALVALGAAVVVAPMADHRSVAEAAPSVSLAGPTTTTAGSPTASSAPPEPIAAPSSLLIVGDSLVHQGLPTLRDRFAAAGIEVSALGGPGQSLMFEDARWAQEIEDAIAELDPDVVVLESCCGFGSARMEESFVLPDGSVAVPDAELTWREWDHQAADVVRIARSRGAATLWVLAPPASTNGYYGPVEGRIGEANGRYQELARCRGDLGLIDWGRLTAPDGSYASHLPDATGRMIKVRADDGFHFTLAGQALLSDLTVESVLTHWRRTGGRSDPAPAADACGARPVEAAPSTTTTTAPTTAPTSAP